MKVRDEKGYLSTKDHPHEIINEKVMRFDEIRMWLRELAYNPEYGWTKGGGAGLCRALGYEARDVIRNKLAKGRWIWPKEQVRLTARINDILEGRIVPRIVRHTGGRPRIEGVYVDPPQPPVVRRAKMLHGHLDLNGRLRMKATDRKVQQLPQFGMAFQEVQFWDPDAARAKKRPAD